MIGLRLCTIIRKCDKLIVRNYRGNRLAASGGSNPGLDKRLRAFQQEALPIDKDDAEEFIETSESDFANAGESYNEHLFQSLSGKHDLRRNIVKEKYFKENMPNLLTWSEKEQIRYLANTAPDEWTLEKLAESFPVTIPIVKKLLKYPWKPATEQRIARHDASVLRNWRELKEGTLSIPENLRQHFLKFSDRTIPPLKESSLKVDITPKDKEMGEFEQIVRRCAANDNSEHSNESQTSSSEQVRFTRPKEGNKKMTLDELAKKIQIRMSSGNELDMNDEIIIKTINTNSKNKSDNIDKEIELFDDTKNEKQVTAFKDEENKEKNIMDYPERIRIPKKAYKKGATYKVDDCYYDHDGRFLYRVLGM